MTIPYHHCFLAIVALSRRYVLAQELRRRDQTRALYASDGSRSVRWLTPRSSFSQTLLTFGRTTIALLVTYCASQLFLANEQYTATSLVTNIGSPRNIDALGLFSVILSWALLSVLIVEQYFSILPLGRSVRMASLCAALVESYNNYNYVRATNSNIETAADDTLIHATLQMALVWGFAILCLICQYSGEYRRVNQDVQVPQVLKQSSNSLRIVFLTIGTRGDVQPFVALGKALLKAGHRPVITTHNNFQSFIEENGIEFQYCGTEMDQPGLLGKAADGANVYVWFKEALKKITGELYTTVNTHMYESCIGCDMIVSTGHTVGQAMDFAEKLNCLHWCCRLTPHEWFTRSFGAHSQRGTSFCGCWNLLNHYKYWLDIGKAYGEANIAALQHAFRANVLKLVPSDPGLSRIFEMFEVPTLFVVSRSVVPQPSDWPVPSNVCGWFFLNQLDYKPPQDLMDFLNAEPNSPPVCINFGSMVLVERTTFITDAAKATLRCGKRVLLITGWASPPKDLPSNCFCIRSVPHEYIFNKCCAVIHHGGAGTVARVLEAGVPSIVVPILIGTDQPWWANRVEELKCGIHVQSHLKNQSPTSHDIEIALRRTLNGKKESIAIHKALENVAKGMKCENGVLNFVNAVTKVAEQMKTKEKKEMKKKQ